VNLLQSLLHTALTLVPLVTLGVGSWVASRIVKPRDHERAQHLANIASDAVALVLANNPTASWATLLADAVRQISTAAGVPTNNAAAIQRAAAGALAKAGVSAVGNAAK
jgi:hypothetical protein